MVDESLAIPYGDHATVSELVDVVTYCAESVSRSYEGWDDPRARGPGLYFVIVAGTSVAGFADPMGANRWPVDQCRVVEPGNGGFFEAAREVALEADGAVIISVDGVIQEQMVRLKDLSGEDFAAFDVDAIEYRDWMGARHMSAVDTSLRGEVIAAVTVSEETGRVTVFSDGNYDDVAYSEIGGKWRKTE
jgi:diadenylate cyclase